MGMEFDTKRKQHLVDVHYVNSPIPCVVEENYLPPEDVLQDQESVYRSFQRETQTRRASSNGESRSNRHGGPNIGEENSSGVFDVASQLALDEAMARELQEMEDQLAGASLSEISDVHSSNSSASSSRQTTSNTTDQVAQDDIDPDNMTYEELQSLGEAVGTESRGLSDELISYLPSFTYKTGFFSWKEKQEECVICYMAYKNRDKLIKLPCEHHYHSSCITQWLKINKACPVCNEEVFGS